MSNRSLISGQKIDKRQVEAAVLFAIKHVPHVDEATLEQFLELVNITGNFGQISDRQILRAMTLLTRLVPDVCTYSLATLVELLDIHASWSFKYELDVFTEEISQKCF